MLLLKVGVDALEVAAAVGGEECAGVFFLFSVTETDTVNAGYPRVPRELAKGLRVRDSDEFC